MLSFFSFDKSVKNLWEAILIILTCGFFNSVKAQQPYRYDNILYKALYWNEAIKLMNADKNYLLLDVRTQDEFNNKAKETWRNRGNLVGAVNMPSGELTSKLNELASYRYKPVIVYDFSGQNESFTAAKTLASAGFKNVYLMMDGIWDLRWKAANIKGLDYLNRWVENVPSDNL